MEDTGCIPPAAYHPCRVSLQAMPWRRVRQCFDRSADTEHIFFCPQVSWWFYQKTQTGVKSTHYPRFLFETAHLITFCWDADKFPDKLGLRHAEEIWNVRRAVTQVLRIAVFQLSWFFESLGSVWVTFHWLQIHDLLPKTLSLKVFWSWETSGFCTRVVSVYSLSGL